MTLQQLDVLKDAFYLAESGKVPNDNGEAYKALLKGYEEHFGALWPSVKHVMLEHSGADLTDYLAD